jgi:hypothetical protein
MPRGVAEACPPNQRMDTVRLRKWSGAARIGCTLRARVRGGVCGQRLSPTHKSALSPAALGLNAQPEVRAVSGCARGGKWQEGARVPPKGVASFKARWAGVLILATHQKIQNRATHCTAPARGTPQPHVVCPRTRGKPDVQTARDMLAGPPRVRVLPKTPTPAMWARRAWQAKTKRPARVRRRSKLLRRRGCAMGSPLAKRPGPVRVLHAMSQACRMPKPSVLRPAERALVHPGVPLRWRGFGSRSQPDEP